MQPILVFIGGQTNRFTAKDHNYFGGESIEKSIVAVWDGPGITNFSIDWEAFCSGGKIAGGTERFTMKPSTVEKRAISFDAPKVILRTEAVMTIAQSGGTAPAWMKDSFSLTIFPRPVAIITTRKYALYDPAGNTTKDLSALGVSTKPIQRGDKLDGFDVLIIGFKALSGDKHLPFSADDIKRGLSVLMLEQDVASLEAIGFRIQDVVPRYTFPRVKDHAALEGLTAASLINWRGESELLPKSSEGMKVWSWEHAAHVGNYGSVASVVIETPHKGAFTPIIDCEFDLAYTPLLEWKHGEGRVVYSQLDITGRDEPVAKLIYINLIRYLDKKPAVAQRKNIIYAGTDESEMAFLESLGLACEKGAAVASPDTVIVAGKNASYSAEQKWTP
jgi:beta-galactosidase